MASFSFLKRLFPVAALGVALAVIPGCQETEQEMPEKTEAPAEVMYPVHFLAREIETRTVFGEKDGTGYPTLWSANDSKIAVSLNLAGAKEAVVTPAADYKTATFDATFPQSEVQAPYVFYALTPYSACVSATVSHGGYHLAIPASQTPLATSCDEAAQLLAASKGAESIAAFSQVEFQFEHVTAYGKLTLKNLAISNIQDVHSIELTASVPFAGEFYYAFSDKSLTECAASQTITLLPANLTFAENQIQDIWFACAPADLGGGSLTVVVNTNAGKWTRTVDIPTGRLAFNSGQVSTFSVNMQNADFTENPDRWVLVEDASKLVVGDEIIFASSATPGAAYAMSTQSTTQGTNDYRNATTVNISQDPDQSIVIRSPGSEVATFTLTSDDNSKYQGYFCIQDKGTSKFLYSSSSGNSSGLYSAVAITGHEDYAHWAFSIREYVASVTTYGKVGNSHRKILYSGSGATKTFITGTSSSSSVYIYRKTSGMSTDDDPVLQNSEYGAYLTSGSRVFVTGCQMSREYPGDETVTFAILTPSDNRVDEFGGIPASPVKGDSFTLHYTVISGREVTDTYFTVSVLKVDGPKVWVSDGSGNGFIVKK